MIMLWIFGLVLLGAVVYLNFTGTKIIQSSQIHTASKKRNLILMVWIFPVAGIFVALYLINRDIKKHETKIEKDIAPAIRELADKLRTLEANIEREEKKQKFH